MIKHDEEFVPRHFSLTIHVMYSVHIRTYNCIHYTTHCMHIIQSKQRYRLETVWTSCFKRFGKSALVEKRIWDYVRKFGRGNVISYLRKVRMFCHRYIIKTFLGTQSLQNFPAFFNSEGVGIEYWKGKKSEGRKG